MEGGGERKTCKRDKGVDTANRILDKQLHSHETMRYRVNHDADMIEIGANCVRAIVPLVFTPDDLDKIIANVPFLESEDAM